MLLQNCQTYEYCCHKNTVVRQLFKTGFFQTLLSVRYMNTLFNSWWMSNIISAQNGKEQLAVLICDTILLNWWLLTSTQTAIFKYGWRLKISQQHAINSFIFCMFFKHCSFLSVQGYSSPLQLHLSLFEFMHGEWNVVNCVVMFSDYGYLHRPHYNQQYYTESIFTVRLLAVEKATLLLHSNWWCYQLNSISSGNKKYTQHFKDNITYRGHTVTGQKSYNDLSKEKWRTNARNINFNFSRFFAGLWMKMKRMRFHRNQ